MTANGVIHVPQASPRGELEEERAMPLTRNFNDLVKSRVEADPAFRQALFREAVQTMLDGDVATAKSVLRDYINAGSEAEGAGRRKELNALSLRFKRRTARSR
jgi:TolA-binding protein